MTPARDLQEALGRREAYMLCWQHGVKPESQEIAEEYAADLFPAPACDPVTRDLWLVHHPESDRDMYLYATKQQVGDPSRVQYFVRVTYLPDPPVVGPSGTAYRVHQDQLQVSNGMTWAIARLVDFRDVDTVSALMGGR